MKHINVEEQCLVQEEVRSITRLWAQSESKATFEINRRNLMWSERKYLQAITKASKSLKRKASEANTARITAVSKKNVAIEDDTDYDDN